MRAAAQQQRRNPRGFRRQHQPAGRGEIERPGIAPGLQQHDTKGFAAQPFLGGAQGILRVRRRDEGQPGRIETEGGQARAIGLARLAPGEILPHPEPGTPEAEPDGAGQREAGGRHGIAGFGGTDLMHAAANQPATQGGIRRGMAQRRANAAALQHPRAAIRPDGGDPRPQRGDGSGRQCGCRQSSGVRGGGHGSTGLSRWVISSLFVLI